MVDKKYFHELSKDEIRDLKDRKVGWAYIREHYSQPSWCNYPTALDFSYGCWLLTDTFGDECQIKSFKDCCSCDFYNSKE